MPCFPLRTWEAVASPGPRLQLQGIDTFPSFAFAPLEPPVNGAVGTLCLLHPEPFLVPKPPVKTGSDETEFAPHLH